MSSNHINEFQGQAKLTIKCKCGKGYLYQKLTEILKILKEKKDSDESFLYKRRNNIKIEITDGCQCKINPRPEANKFSSFFCLDCLQYVCAKCKSDKNNIRLFEIKMIKRATDIIPQNKSRTNTPKSNRI